MERFAASPSSSMDSTSTERTTTAGTMNVEGSPNADVVRLACVARIEVKSMPEEKPTTAHHGNAASRLVPLDVDSEESGAEESPRRLTFKDEESSIRKSPYELRCNAEDDVASFEKIKILLSETSEDDGPSSVQPEAAKIFGPTNAWVLVRTAALIDKSGMVFSQEWIDGTIRGNKIGKMPKHLLLMCLVSGRFAKAAEQLLAGLVRDLDVCDSVRSAVTEWGLDNQYRKISRSKKMFTFSSLKRDCYKSCIFIARAFACLKALREDEVPDVLLNRIKFCLDMVESRVLELSKKRKKVPDGAPSSPSTHKPKLDKAHESPSRESYESDFNDDYASSPRASPMKSSESFEEANPPSPSESDEEAASPESIAALIDRFDSQYEDVKNGVKEMGKTLTALKKRLKSNEQDIRDEIVAQVKKSIMGSLS